MPVTSMQLVNCSTVGPGSPSPESSPGGTLPLLAGSGRSHREGEISGTGPTGSKWQPHAMVGPELRMFGGVR